MSSILKALRRLEQEGEVQETHDKGLVNPGKTIARRSRRNYWKTRAITLFMFVLLIGVVAGFYVLYPLLMNGLRNYKSEQTGKRSFTTAPIRREVMKSGSKIVVKKEIVKKTIPVSSFKKENPPKRLEPYAQKETHLLQSSVKQKDIQEKGIEGPDLEGLKLEAIVWANNPSSRFAVINGEIVRSGSMVKGMKLINIGRDHVTLMKAGAVRRLGFRNH